HGGQLKSDESARRAPEAGCAARILCDAHGIGQSKSRLAGGGCLGLAPVFLLIEFSGPQPRHRHLQRQVLNRTGNHGAYPDR
ncbi:MAG: hypothetical protein Q7J77_11500, partial [Undibacterium sp.]|nr:hypothetical protein [Undibacterium sp.]